MKKFAPTIVVLLFASLAVTNVHPQSSLPEGAFADAMVGTWEGPLVMGRDEMKLAFTFTLEAGDLSAALISEGMGIYGMPADSFSLDGINMKILIRRLDGEFNGTLRFDDSGERVIRIDGDWFQYSEMIPVVLLPVTAPTF